jgi:hypothetical protein
MQTLRPGGIPTRTVSRSGAAPAPSRARGVRLWPATCGRFSPGHYQRVSLSPVSAIADMVAPVVIITLAAFLSNGLLTASITIGGWVLALDRERHGILRGPHGEMLDEGSVPPADRERLTQIRNDTLQITRRIQRLRTAVLFMWIAIGLLVLGVAAIAAAVTARSEALGFTALALVLAGWPCCSLAWPCRLSRWRGRVRLSEVLGPVLLGNSTQDVRADFASRTVAPPDLNLGWDLGRTFYRCQPMVRCTFSALDGPSSAWAIQGPGIDGSMTPSSSQV